jgi:hypothetical protein
MIDLLAAKAPAAPRSQGRLKAGAQPATLTAQKATSAKLKCQSILPTFGDGCP